MKKTAIITYYYNSVNYGGNLQAYALCKKLNDMGGNAEQICFDAQASSLKSGSLKDRVKRILRRVRGAFYKNKNAKFNKELYTKRHKSFSKFNSVLTPHSKAVYNKDTIKNSVDDYDIFITGSDQVWNPNWYVPSYYLDFVPDSKKKVSYATSFGVSNFTEEQKNIIKDHVSTFFAVSLRENSILESEDVFFEKPVITVDPTLLLSKTEWEALCQENTMDSEYVFCYFFGESKKNRAIAKEYAEKNNCKIVAITHLNGYNDADVGFADVERPYASPEEFITLIKNAKCIFTDSFHAVVFSNILQKEYYVFKRSEVDTMSSRIYSITRLFKSEQRFLHAAERQTVEYISSLEPIDYTRENAELQRMKKESESFLKKILQL